jgi:hypothetical protein
MFSDHSSDPDAGDDISVWSWDFGDGKNSNGQSPTHTYANQGTYTVVLEVTDNNAASATVSASFRVKNRGKVSGSVGDSGNGGDPGGTTIETERGKKKCSDGIDNDGDGLVDGADPECQ